MNRQILHVTTSVSFMDFTAGVFEEVAPGRNVFAGVGVPEDSFHFSVPVHVESVAAGKAGGVQLRDLVARSDIAVFHNVVPEVAKALASAPSSVLKVWSGWGGDYYGSTFDSSARLLGPGTRRLINSELRPTFWAGRALHTLRFSPVLHAAASAADVFSAPIPEDLDIFRRRFPGFAGQFSQLNYVSVEDSLVTGEAHKLGRDILVGHSAAPVDNHLEVFEFLAHQELANRRVLVPLSYGDQGYAAQVKRAGRELLGDHFVPIVDFLPLDEYHELIANCGIAMMGSYRQVGLGNILRAIWQGAHLVLHPRNPLADYLRRRGVPTLFFDELASSGLPSAPPPADQVERNRAFLGEYWSRQTALRNTKALIDLA